MTSLATELKQVISRRLDVAPHSELISIVSSLCNEPAPVVQLCGIESQWEVFNNVWAFDRASGLYMTRDYVPGGQRKWQASMDAAAQFTPIKPGMKCRAPTIHEQLRMVDYTKRNPAFNKAIFHGDHSWVWTSTELVNSDGSPSGCAWVVFFGGGFSSCSYRNSSGFIRAVCVSQ